MPPLISSIAEIICSIFAPWAEDEIVLLTLIKPEETGIEYMNPRPGSVILPARAISAKTSSASDLSTTHQTNSFSGPLVILRSGILSLTPPPSPKVTVGPGAPFCNAALAISSAIPFSQIQHIASISALLSEECPSSSAILEGKFDEV